MLIAKRKWIWRVLEIKIPCVLCRKKLSTEKKLFDLETKGIRIRKKRRAKQKPDETGMLCRRTARLTWQQPCWTSSPREVPALLSFCDLSFHTRYSEHVHDRDHQTNQISKWSGNDSFFSLNYYNMNGISNKGLTASKIIATPWHLDTWVTMFQQLWPSLIFPSQFLRSSDRHAEQCHLQEPDSGSRESA